MVKPLTIYSFKGNFAFLSNFAEINIFVGNKLWKTTEHLYMANKTLDATEIETIRLAETPNDAKQLGKIVTLRTNWNNIKDDIMLMCLRYKFTKNKLMQTQLLKTNNYILIEGNCHHDKYWGKCNCSNCKNNGLNKLGKLLMQVRQELRNTIVTSNPEDLDW